MISAKIVAVIAASLVIGVTVFLGPEQLSKNPAGNPEPVSLVQIDRMFDDSFTKAFKTPKPGNYALPVIKQAGDAELLDIHGRSVRLSEIGRRKISIVSFIYTSCSAEKGCPFSMSTLFDIFHASEKVPGLARHVVLTTISFDPLRDTPQAMAAYGTAALADRNRKEKMPWHFLTAKDEKTLAPLLAAFGQSIHRQSSSDTIDHLLRLYLIDRQGRIRNIYGLGFMDPRLLYADIFTLLLEDGTIKGPSGKSGA